MAITVDTLRAAGLTPEQIVRVLEIEQKERLAARREQNRINQRNFRKANKINGHVIHVIADSADSADMVPPPKEKSPTPPKEITPSSPLTSFVGANLEAAEKNQAKSSKKGCRLSPDWQPMNGDAEFALKTLPEGWRIEADKFRDYWIARPGAQGCKLDWSATWRNWLRKAAESKPNGQKNLFQNGTDRTPTRGSYYPKGYVIE